MKAVMSTARAPRLSAQPYHAFAAAPVQAERRMSVLEIGNRVGRHAVVIGAGIGGLIAARVLSDHFVRVTLVERDALPEAPVPRSWMPQGQHAHVLSHRGQAILEQLFPGLFVGMGASGSVGVDLGSQMRWQHLGVVSTRARSGVTSQFQSRYALEWHVCQQVRSLDNVCVLERAQVTGLRTNCTGEAISGVEIRSLDGSDARSGVLTADLVVDASGRGSQLPRWLEALGYDSPAQTDIGIDFAYASRIYRRPRGLRSDWKVLLCHQDPSAGRRSVHIVPIEDERWIVTAGGRLGSAPPADEAGFLEFLRSVVSADVFAAIRDAEALTPIVAARFASNQWRHYERLKRFPARLTAIGDALCSINPIYGQGMAICALQAMALDRCIRRSGGLLDRAAQRFPSAVARMVELPWMLAACEDFRYPETSGPRPAFAGLLNWYAHKVRRLSATDAQALLDLLAMLHLERHPITLYRPAMICKVLLSCFQRHRAAAIVPAGAVSNLST
jgi:2-polyprenyl-6-methoxyphenol hydroxylase-like FAD-dependent oxidoreductase